MAFLVFCAALGKPHFLGFGIGNVATPEVGNDREGIQRKHGLVLHPKSKHTLQNNRDTQMGVNTNPCLCCVYEDAQIVCMMIEGIAR